MAASSNISNRKVTVAKKPSSEKAVVKNTVINNRVASKPTKKKPPAIKATPDKTSTSETFTDLAGVYSSAICCGIKPGRDDLSYIYIPEASACAAVFTRCKFAAPCIKYSQDCLKKGVIKAVIINAGNANAATGKRGYENAKATASHAAKLLKLKPSEVATCSTGIIGVQLPVEKVISGLDSLLKDPFKTEGERTAKAILTTDLVKKSVHKEFTVGKKKFTISGITKGSGMIAPNMGTMLCYVVTDAQLSKRDLQKNLVIATDDSFNMMSVDTDTSTNDCVFLFSTGKVGIISAKEKLAFQKALTEVCQDLAKMIAQDGEGATKLIEAKVSGAKNVAQARIIAKNIIDSPLVKTAIHGADPNWGRIIAAAGKDPSVAIIPEKILLKFQGIEILKNGEMTTFTRENVAKALKDKFVLIELDLKVGKSQATAWGCDLTKGYIDINTAYS